MNVCHLKPPTSTLNQPLHWVMFCKAYPDGQKHCSVWLIIAQPCEHPWLVGHTSRAEETMGIIDKQQKIGAKNNTYS